MIKHSETILKTHTRRYDTSWKFEWKFTNPEDEGTIFLDPNASESENPNDTWYFKGDAEDTYIDEYEWNPDHPVFQYKSDNNNPPEGDGTGPNETTETWNEEHPNNNTRYLSPSDDVFFKMVNTIENVNIDPNPPKFESDYGTDYVSLTSEYKKIVNDDGSVSYEKKTDNKRHISFMFDDAVGLDPKYFKIEILKPNSDPTILYYYDTVNNKKVIETDYIENIDIKSDGRNLYNLEFDLTDKVKAYPDKYGNDGCIYLNDLTDIVDIDNLPTTWYELEQMEKDIQESLLTLSQPLKGLLKITIFDLAGNCSEYYIEHEFDTIDLSDLNDLEKVIITFRDKEPSDMYIQPNMEGKVVCEIYNPNVCLWRYDIIGELEETSVGTINQNTYESGFHKPVDGIREFIVDSIYDYGKVIVDGWVSTGNSKIDDIIKEKTFNVGECGPWLCASEGRLYHLMEYVPKYLRNTQLDDFWRFFELYLNTAYLGMNKKKNISILEKIARIGNFNDIVRLENELVYKYANEFGNEFDFNIDTLKGISNILNNGVYNEKDEEEIFDQIKYVLEQLPNYNQYKGTNTGISMAIRMFGLTCKIINLWAKPYPEIDDTKAFIQEDSLKNYNGYYMTNRFNVKMDSIENTFDTISENVEFIINLIKSVKPITKILNEVKYSVTLKQPLTILHRVMVAEETNKKNYVDLEIIWNPNIIIEHKKMIKSANIKGSNMKSLSFSYKPEKYVNQDYTIRMKYNGVYYNNQPSNVHNIIGKFALNNNKKLYICCEKNNQFETFIFNERCYNIFLNSGSFVLSSVNGSPNLLKMYNNYVFNSNDETHIHMYFRYIIGTNYIVSLQNFGE